LRTGETRPKSRRFLFLEANLPAQFCQEIRRVNGFGENFEFVPLSAGLFKQIRGCGLTRKEKDFALWQLAASDDCSFNPGHTGHDDIADEHVGLKAFDQLDGLFSAIDCACVKACLIEDNCQSIRDYLLVIGNKNLGF